MEETLDALNTLIDQLLEEGREVEPNMTRLELLEFIFETAQEDREGFASVFDNELVVRIVLTVIEYYIDVEKQLQGI